MSKAKKWFNNIGRLIKHEKDDGRVNYFLVFERQKDKEGNYKGESPFPIVINEGDIIPAKLKRDDLKGLVEGGFMTQEKADEIFERVKYEFSLPPKEDEESEEEEREDEEPPKKSTPAKNSSKPTSVKKNKGNKGEVDF